MNRDSEQYLQRLKENLPLGKDPTVVILRGHLFIEELLDQILAVALKDASAIKDARLTYFQKLCLAQGVLGFEKNRFMWKPFKDLNKLRNDISHNLPDAALSKKLDIVLRTFFEDDFPEIPNNIYSKSKALRKGIISQCAILFGFISAMKLALSYSRDKNLGRIR
ncbi:MAG: hypothetical protein LLF76_04290 [Planctomycetaceae bacterium]|nr:hypothetical protein [Planctomycetaceae bacterium]